MTIAPESPKLVPIEGKSGTKRLAEDHLTFVKVGFGYSIEVLIKNGYETDGATIPEQLMKDKEYGNQIWDFIRSKYRDIKTTSEVDDLIRRLVGTPWDMPRLLAAIVHDVLYGLKWKIRWLCDRIYRLILLENNYDLIRADIEYCGIRLIGWKNWEAGTKAEKRQTKQLTVVRFIRDKKIRREIERLRKDRGQ